MRELPLGVRSTAMVVPSLSRGPGRCFVRKLLFARRLRRCAFLRQSRELFFDSVEARFHDAMLREHRGVDYSSGQSGIAPPPVQADLFRFVDRADEQPNLNRQQLDICQVDLDVARDDEPFVQDTVEDIDQAMRSRWIYELRQSGAPIWVLRSCTAAGPMARDRCSDRRPSSQTSLSTPPCDGSA